MAPHSLADERDGFQSMPSSQQKRRMSSMEDKENWAGISLTPMYVGIAATPKNDHVEIGFCIHDGTYSTDYCVQELNIPAGASVKEKADTIEKHAVDQLINFSVIHCFKFVGAGVTEKTLELSPGLCAALWREMDIVAMVFKVSTTAPKYGLVEDSEGTSYTSDDLAALANMGNVHSGDGEGALISKQTSERIPIEVDEQADSAARKCTQMFGPGGNPALAIGYRNQVEVDNGGIVRLVGTLEEYKRTVGEGTWATVMKYVKDLKIRHVKVAFFSSTPQGGGVALMRHALVRFLRMAGVHIHWYVPKPNPRVFRITKNNHNILQGVAPSTLRLTEHQKKQMDEWITSNAQRSWLSPGGPLAKGGVDVVIIDDPQMPGLIPLIKKTQPDLPIIYRSHIEIRSDLIAQPGSPQAEVWDYLWERIKLADVFISHPIDSFIPSTVPTSIVGLMPASTDWLDGLSKPMKEWDLRYYHHNFRVMCADVHMSKLAFPARDYIIQIARFDPSKGIPHVIDAFCKLRRRLDEELPFRRTPQLLLCGHGAIDDPDASIVYDEIMQLLEQPGYAHYASDIIVMRIGPSDQMLNALLTKAKIALQLSTREGFEVKVSESLHKGKPIIATRAGGIPLQVQHEKNGFLIDVGDTQAAADYMYRLWTDPELYKRMSEYARASVSDEVSTVGNAVCWLYLASKLSKGELLKPNRKWINDMAREDALFVYKEGEPRLPRSLMKATPKPVQHRWMIRRYQEEEDESNDD